MEPIYFMTQDIRKMLQMQFSYKTRRLIVKRMYLMCALVIMGIVATLLTGCSRLKKDEEIIAKYLNDIYGKDAYVVQKDPEYKSHFLVNLKEYPKLQFMVTVSRQPFTSPYIWSNFDKVFSEHAIKQFKQSNDLLADEIQYSDPQFIYSTKINSLEELKTSYDKLMKFVNFVSQEYPILIDTGVLDIRLDVSGLKLKGDIEDEMKYFDICEAKQGTLTIKPYDELYDKLVLQIKTHSENQNGVVFKVSDGRSFALGSDTFEDCLYKNLELKNYDAKALDNITLKPGEVSDVYNFASTDNYNFVNIEIQAKNLTDSVCSLYDATIIKAIITGAKEIYIDPVWIDLKFSAWDNATGRKWIDPYDALKILPPKTKTEKIEGTLYKNIKILFEEYHGKDWKEIRRVTLIFQQ